MATRPDPWTTALAQLPSTDQTRRSIDTDSSSETLTNQPKPTRGHHACITELGLRFPKARDDDPQSYALRMDYLAKDCAHITVPLLRAACDRAAQSARGMPYASEILGHAAVIVEERQTAAARAATPHGRPVPIDPRADALTEKSRQYNRENADIGSPVRWSTSMDIFIIGDLGERRATRADGSIIEPWFKPATPGQQGGNSWHPPEGATAELSAAYREHGARFAVVRGEIVESNAMMGDA